MGLCRWGAGAAALAALCKERGQLQERRAAVILTGQNIDRVWMQSVLAEITSDVLAVTGRLHGRNRTMKFALAACHPSRLEKWHEPLTTPTAALQSYSASGVGLTAGGSIPNVLAVIQVIEKLPIEAVNATRLSNPIAFSAAV
jgi:hypothetical protein